LGSGTTLIAAERTGRCCYGMELDPLYADLVIRRWQNWTGEQAVALASGRTFDELEQAGRDEEASSDER
jgi:DNA modification methylase